MEESIESALSALNRAVNSFGDSSGLASAIARMHPTLRQKFFGDVVLNVIRELALAHRSGYTDGRDECAGSIANRVWEFLQSDKELGTRFSFRDEQPVKLPFI